MRYRWIFLLIIGVLVVTSPPPASATIIIPATLEYMTDFVDTVVIGHVKEQQSYWEEQKIMTEVIIEVDEFIKNATGETATQITLKYLGGTVGDTSFEFDEAPIFHNDEKTMLFLKKTGTTYLPFAFSYGVYKIIFDDVEQQEIVDGPLFHQTEHYNLATMEPVPVPEDLLTTESRTVDAFVKRVKQLIEQ